MLDKKNGWNGKPIFGLLALRFVGPSACWPFGLLAYHLKIISMGWRFALRLEHVVIRLVGLPRKNHQYGLEVCSETGTCSNWNMS